MPPTIETVEADALQLTAAERADLIERLITSLGAVRESKRPGLRKSRGGTPKSRTARSHRCLARRRWPSLRLSLREVQAASRSTARSSGSSSILS